MYPTGDEQFLECWGNCEKLATSTDIKVGIITVMTLTGKVEEVVDFMEREEC